jgi:hypothetical protein
MTLIVLLSAVVSQAQMGSPSEAFACFPTNDNPPENTSSDNCEIMLVTAGNGLNPDQMPTLCPASWTQLTSTTQSAI